MKVFLVLGALLLLSSVAFAQNRGYNSSNEFQEERRLNPRDCMRYSRESQREMCFKHVHEMNERRKSELNEIRVNAINKRRMDEMYERRMKERHMNERYMNERHMNEMSERSANSANGMRSMNGERGQVDSDFDH